MSREICSCQWAERPKVAEPVVRKPVKCGLVGTRAGGRLGQLVARRELRVLCAPSSCTRMDEIMRSQSFLLPRTCSRAFGRLPAPHPSIPAIASITSGSRAFRFRASSRAR